MRHLWPINDLIEAEQSQAERQSAAQIWRPYTGRPQEAAYLSPADVIGYGGAAGGGKTDLALGLAITQHHRSIIFRREMPNARGIIERSRELLNQHGRFNENLHIWRLSGGRTIEIASMPLEKNKSDHQGQARDLHVFDEATEFTDSQVRFVIGWNRSARVGQRCRVLLTFNPPITESQDWVVNFFAPWLKLGYPDPAQDGELRYTAMDKEGHELFFRAPMDAPIELRDELKTRTFFHASLDDNPALQESGYAATIAAMPEPIRSALRGSFTAARGVDIWQVIPRAWVEAAMARWEASTEVPLSGAGLDVARGGPDETALARIYGPQYIAELDVVPGVVTPDGGSAAQIAIARQLQSVPVGVDVIGVGGSAYDHLLGAGYDARPMNAAEGTDQTDRSGKLLFANRRALWWWRMREALDPDHGDKLALPPDQTLLVDLTTPRWRLQGRRITIESKDDLRKRIGRSPNRADAVIMALAAGQTIRAAGLVDYL